MTTPDPGRETMIVPLRGRDIVIRQLVDTQLMMMGHEAKLLQRADLARERKLESVDRMFRILRSAVVQDEDRDYMDDLIVEGALDLRELLTFATAFNQEVVDAKPKVRRGRPATKRA